ncbi:hypothetical protein Holit_00973 [Hollandina sp. SP2]
MVVYHTPGFSLKVKNCKLYIALSLRIGEIFYNFNQYISIFHARNSYFSCQVTAVPGEGSGPLQAASRRTDILFLYNIPSPADEGLPVLSG